MSEFEDRLNSILNDPEQMEKITSMAQSLMGAQNAPGSNATPSQKPESGLLDNFDPAMLSRLTTAFSSMNQSDDKQALLMALKPYLSDKRREKLERAMKLAKLIHIAEFAFGTLGGGKNAKI